MADEDVHHKPANEPGAAPAGHHAHADKPADAPAAPSGSKWSRLTTRVRESFGSAKGKIGALGVSQGSKGIEPARLAVFKDTSVPVIECKSLTKTFFDHRTGTHANAIEDVTFTIEDIPDVGELITILGPSGCGKSTLLNIIAGLEPHFPHTSGEIKMKGQAVAGPGPDRGMVFQSYSSFPCYTVLENVAFGLMLQGVPEKEREDIAADWIKKVRLEGFERKYPKELSGGMRQRVALARTLAVNPRVILMDEPYGALDRVTRWEMQDLLIELWSKVQATVFLVTHDIPEAAFLGDRVFLMSARPGRLREIVKLPRPTEKAAQMQRTTQFAEIVNEISKKVEAIR